MKLTDKNTVSADKYILYHIAGGVLLTLWIFVFMPPERSVWMFVFLVSVLALEVQVTYNFRRSYFNVLVNLFIPPELIVLFCYYERNIVLTVILCMVWIILSAAYAVPFLLSEKRRKKRRMISVTKIRWILLGSRTIFSVVMLAALLPLFVFYRVPPVPTQVSAAELQCIAESCDASLSRLRAEIFRTLSRKEKEDVLLDICCTNFADLNIDHGFSLKCEELHDVYLAVYSESDYTIIVNAKYIDKESSFTLLKGMCHECYHAYQNVLIRGNDSFGQYTEEEREKVAAIYAEEQSHYCPPDEDVEKYRAQRLERDADAYADKACVKYLRYYDLPEEQIEAICRQINADKKEGI